ncbi:hypothetical protein LAUMK15_02449 [Mycobacterium persicum]|nr:hypothetical protein LAUMK15_02449 [Mycobacterium persicum]
MNAPTQTLFNRPLIGNGANGAPVPGAPLAPLPISGRLNSVWVGAFTRSSNSCPRLGGCAAAGAQPPVSALVRICWTLAASALAYEPAAALNAWENQR